MEKIVKLLDMSWIASVFARAMVHMGLIERGSGPEIIDALPSNGLLFILGFIIIAFIIYQFVEDDPNPWQKQKKPDQQLQDEEK